MLAVSGIMFLHCNSFADMRFVFGRRKSVDVDRLGEDSHFATHTDRHSRADFILRLPGATGIGIIDLRIVYHRLLGHLHDE